MRSSAVAKGPWQRISRLIGKTESDALQRIPRIQSDYERDLHCACIREARGAFGNALPSTYSISSCCIATALDQKPRLKHGCQACKYACAGSSCDGTPHLLCREDTVQVNRLVGEDQCCNAAPEVYLTPLRRFSAPLTLRKREIVRVSTTCPSFGKDEQT